jgi:DNA-directed RNA polymerase subunit RPC12/RpoP
MRSYICRSCENSIIVGAPRRLFLRRARAIARETTSLLQRLLHPRRHAKQVAAAMETRYYADPYRYETLPSACPRCGFRAQGDTPWWKPGVTYPD